MNWNKLENESDLSDFLQKSKDFPQQNFLIFKHSTRCPVSAMALQRLEKKWHCINDNIPLYLLDILRFRPLSDKIQHFFGVRHESPQILIIRNGQCIYHQSHHLISVDEINKHLK